MSNELLARVSGHLNTWLDKRESLVAKREAILKDAEMDKREALSETEEAEYQTLGNELREADEHIKKFRDRIAELEEEQRRTEEAEEARKLTVNVDRNIRVSERRTYEPGNQRSYFLDLARANMRGDVEARQRLDRHAIEVQSEPEYRDLNRTDGTGGQFVPPAHLMDQFLRLRRAGRATANVVRNLPLPGGTDSITIPGLSTGGATALQSADNAAVQETDPTDRSISVPVRTIAGQVDVALQLLDQSPIAADEILLDDLIRSYNNSLGTQILTAASWGLLNQANIGAVTYTDATPTVGELYPKLADAVNRVATGIFSEPSVIVMHPRRWAWLLAALDTQGRPLVVPTSGANQSVNAVGTINDATGGIQRVVGTILGIPVVTDPNMPTNLGAGTNEDAIVVMDANEVFLYESAPRTRVLPEVGSGTLTVRLQVYGYFAFTAARYTAAIAAITGTGLIAPTF